MIPLRNPTDAPAPNFPSDLASWSELAVCDRLFAFYSAALADPDRARQAARLHWSCWRAYINRMALQGRATRQALARMLKDARFDPALIDQADESVVDELSDLVLHKYRRSPQQAKFYIACVVGAATQMALGRVAN